MQPLASGDPSSPPRSTPLSPIREQVTVLVKKDYWVLKAHKKAICGEIILPLLVALAIYGSLVGLEAIAGSVEGADLAKRFTCTYDHGRGFYSSIDSWQLSGMVPPIFPRGTQGAHGQHRWAWEKLAERVAVPSSGWTQSVDSIRYNDSWASIALEGGNKGSGGNSCPSGPNVPVCSPPGLLIKNTTPTDSVPQWQGTMRLGYRLATSWFFLRYTALQLFGTWNQGRWQDLKQEDFNYKFKLTNPPTTTSKREDQQHADGFNTQGFTSSSSPDDKKTASTTTIHHDDIGYEMNQAEFNDYVSNTLSSSFSPGVTLSHEDKMNEQSKSGSTKNGYKRPAHWPESPYLKDKMWKEALKDSKDPFRLEGSVLAEHAPEAVYRFGGREDINVVQLLGTLMAMVMLMGTIPMFSQTCGRLTDEKKGKLREHLRVMGVRPVAYVASTFVFFSARIFLLTIFLTAAFLISGSTRLEVHHFASGIGFLFLFAQALVSAAFFFPCIFKESKYAMAFSSTFLVSGIIGGVYITTPGVPPELQILIAFLFAPVAALQGIAVSLGGFRTTLPVTPTLAATFLVLQIVWYILLSQYFHSLFPGEYGMPQKWYFPFYQFKRFFCSSSSSSSGQRSPVTTASSSSGAAGSDCSVRLAGITKVYQKESKNFILSRLNLLRSKLPFATPSIDDDHDDDEEDGGGGTSLLVTSSGHQQQDERPAVDDLHLDIKKGEILALLGHNGAGKTTTISMLTGMVEPTEYEEATINGLDLVKDVDAIRHHIGVCPQFDILFDDLSALQHMEIFSRIKCRAFATHEGEELLKKLKLPLDSQKASTFSGGMRRRLSVACSIIGGANVLFLDEPSSGLDPLSRRQLWDLVKDQRSNGKTVVLCTHFMEEADHLGDRICIMSRGRVCQLDTSHALKRDHGVGYYLTLVPASSSDRSPPSSTDASSSSHLVDVEGALALCQKFVPEASLVTHATPGGGNQSKNNQQQQEDDAKSTTLHTYTSSSSGGSVETVILLPQEGVDRFGELFTALDSKQLQLGILSYGVRMNSLEDVFVKISSEEDAKDDHGQNRGRTSSSDGPSSLEFVSGSTTLEDLVTAGANCSTTSRVASGVRVMLVQRAKETVRSSSICMDLVLPMIYAFILVYLAIPVNSINEKYEHQHKLQKQYTSEKHLEDLLETSRWQDKKVPDYSEEVKVYYIGPATDYQKAIMDEAKKIYPQHVKNFPSGNFDESNHGKEIPISSDVLSSSNLELKFEEISQLHYAEKRFVDMGTIAISKGILVEVAKNSIPTVVIGFQCNVNVPSMTEGKHNTSYPSPVDFEQEKREYNHALLNGPWDGTKVAFSRASAQTNPRLTAAFWTLLTLAHSNIKRRGLGKTTFYQWPKVEYYSLNSKSIHYKQEDSELWEDHDDATTAAPSAGSSPVSSREKFEAEHDAAVDQLPPFFITLQLGVVMVLLLCQISSARAAVMADELHRRIFQTLRVFGLHSLSYFLSSWIYDVCFVNIALILPFLIGVTTRDIASLYRPAPEVLLLHYIIVVLYLSFNLFFSYSLCAIFPGLKKSTYASVLTFGSLLMSIFPWLMWALLRVIDDTLLNDALGSSLDLNFRTPGFGTTLLLCMFPPGALLTFYIPWLNIEVKDYHGYTGLINRPVNFLLSDNHGPIFVGCLFSLIFWCSFTLLLLYMFASGRISERKPPKLPKCLRRVLCCCCRGEKERGSQRDEEDAAELGPAASQQRGTAVSILSDDLDKDVEDERHRVERQNSDMVAALHVHKVFHGLRTEKRATTEAEQHQLSLDGTATNASSTIIKKNQLVAVDDLTFGVKRGECFGLLGPNGAGKTTTVRMLLREENTTQGTVRYGGGHGEEDEDEEQCKKKKSVSLDEQYLIDRLGVCHQNNTLWDHMTAEEHMELYLKIRLGPAYHYHHHGSDFASTKKGWKRFINRALKQVYLSSAADRNKKRTDQFSGGMKRKLCVGLAMFTGARMVFLDEPSTGMDPYARRALWRSIFDALKDRKRSVLLTTHSMEEADAVCSRIGIMLSGKMRCLGSAQHLKNRFGKGYSVTLEMKPDKTMEEASSLSSGRGGTALDSITSHRTGTIFYSLEDYLDTEVYPAMKSKMVEAFSVPGEVACEFVESIGTTLSFSVIPLGAGGEGGVATSGSRTENTVDETVGHNHDQSSSRDESFPSVSAPTALTPPHHQAAVSLGSVGSIFSILTNRKEDWELVSYSVNQITSLEQVFLDFASSSSSSPSSKD